MTALINIIKAGIHTLEKFPYIGISKVSNNLDTRDTCLNRVERNIFNISAYHDDFDKLLTIVDDIEELLDFQSMTIGNRRFLSLQFVNKFISEPTVGIYQINLTYEIVTQKNFNSSDLSISSSSGSTLFEALHNRSRVNDVLNNFSGFVTTEFAFEEWKDPFLCIPNYTEVEAFATTKSSIRQTDFSLVTFFDDPVEVERLQEEIDNVFSYCSLVVAGRKFTNLEWIGDSLIEVEKDLWRGSVDYSLQLEKDI